MKLATVTKAIAPPALLLGLSLIFDSAWAGTRCVSRQLDWYTDVVGESPCETYQRLRQICNPGYRVHTLGPVPPGDRCDDPDSACCCNTISFQLSMLCEVCQNDPKDGSSVGIDAPIGTYVKYVQGCNPWTNDELPPKVQASVCTAGIRLDDGLYNSWEDGAWFYVWTKEDAIRRHAAANNNTFTHCQDQVPSSASFLPGTSAQTAPTGVSYSIAAPNTATSESSQPTGGAVTSGNLAANSGTSGGTVAGIVVGVLVVLGALAFVLWFLRRQRQRRERRMSRMATPWLLDTPPGQLRQISTSGQIRPYASWSVPPSPINALPSPHSPRPDSSLRFTPEAMVRAPGHVPAAAARDTREPGRRPRRGMLSDDGSAGDSRVGSEPVDNSPDPNMPLVPLRLEEKGRLL